MSSANNNCVGEAALYRSRLKKFFWRESHSFGYISCLEAEDDVYYYALELANAIGLVGSIKRKFEQLSELVQAGCFIEFAKVKNERGEKVVQPIQLLPDGFEGQDELAARLDAQVLERKIRPQFDEGEDCEEEDEYAFDPEVWPDPSGSYVRELQERVSSLLGTKASAKKPPQVWSTENVKDYVQWLSWQHWDPCHAWKGLSCGTWPEKAKEYFSRASPFPGKAKAFVQDIPEVVAWNNNGSTYVYPKSVWAFLQKHSSYDIERVAQDMVKGIATKDFYCQWCEKARIVGKDYYEDQSWYCKSCFLSWQGIGPRGMSDKGRLKKGKKTGKGHKGKKGKK